MFETALCLIQRSEPYQAIEIAIHNLCENRNSGNDASDNSAALMFDDHMKDSCAEVSFCVERFTKWRQCMVRVGTLACSYLRTPGSSVEVPQASRIIGALIYRMPTLRDVVIQALQQQRHDKMVRQADIEKDTLCQSTTGDSNDHDENTNGSKFMHLTPQRPVAAVTLTPKSSYRQHPPFRNNRASLNLRALKSSKILQILCNIVEKNMSLRVNSSCIKDQVVCETYTANKLSDDSIIKSKIDDTSYTMEEEGQLLHDTCYFWDRHEAVLISVLTQSKLNEIDDRLTRMAQISKKKKSRYKKGWLDIICEDPVTCAEVLKHWLSEVVHSMLIYHHDSAAEISDTVVVADAPSVRQDRPLIERFLSKSHILPWESVPGYRDFVEELMTQLDSGPPSAHCMELIDCLKYACANHNVITNVVRILLRRTSIYNTSSVSTCLGLIDNILTFCSSGWSDVTAGGNQTLNWFNADILPLSFDYNFFFKAFDVLLSSDNGQILWKSLGLIFRHWSLLKESQANLLRERIMKRHFFSLMTHWSTQGREFFIVLMLFRISKPRSWEKTRHNVLSEESNDVGKVSATSLTNGDYNFDSDENSKGRTRVKKPWINLKKLKTLQHKNSGKELWKRARIKMNGFTKWLIRDVDTVKASSTPLPPSTQVHGVSELDTNTDKKEEARPPPLTNSGIDGKYKDNHQDDTVMMPSQQLSPIKVLSPIGGISKPGAENHARSALKVTNGENSTSCDEGERQSSSSFRLVEETSIAVEVKLELFDVALKFLKSAFQMQVEYQTNNEHKRMKHVKEKNGDKKNGVLFSTSEYASNRILKNEKFVIFRGKVLLLWYRDNAHMFESSGAISRPSINSYAKDELDEYGEKLGSLMLRAGFFYPVQAEDSSTHNNSIQHTSATIKEITCAAFNLNSVYFSSELHKWEGFCYSHKIDRSMSCLGGISNDARLLCVAGMREFRRVASARTQFKNELDRIKNVKHSLQRMSSKQCLAQDLEDDISNWQKHIERSEDVLNELHDEHTLHVTPLPEWKGSTHTRKSCEAPMIARGYDDQITNDDELRAAVSASPKSEQFFSDALLDARLHHIDKNILCKALRPGDTALWNS